MNRRNFVQAGLSTAVALGLSQNGIVEAANNGRLRLATSADASPLPQIKKSLVIGMIKGGKSVEDTLKIAKDAGFDGVQPNTLASDDEVKAMKEAADKVGIELESMICSKHWSSPLSDPDPKKVEDCMENIRLSMRQIKALGGDTVLLVPAVVTPRVSYQDAYTRSQAKIKELAPYAEELKIMIAVEDVWNKFLLSPIEFKRYLEEINSPYVKAWFDVGNVHLYGFPQDWIRTLGAKFIPHVHIKDFSQKNMQFVPLREGTIDWIEVMNAFKEIDYKGYFTAEVDGGNLEQLKEVAHRMDLIIASAPKTLNA